MKNIYLAFPVTCSVIIPTSKIIEQIYQIYSQLYAQTPFILLISEVVFLCKVSFFCWLEGWFGSNTQGCSIAIPHSVLRGQFWWRPGRLRI